ncbi:MAG: NAD-binding protein [Moritella sp.]|uniref:FAD-dependent oxidoreductase n=1 Tax=Moritella sp. TaxID=78556 RepID=UPI0029AAC8A4|nr:FAD-dependent oxidoreductase [Moritella sp.]MDX2322367.1 NAD-binding protein [Moritella sp.]
MNTIKQSSCNTRMIRTHALLHMAKSIHSIRGAKSQGIEYSEPTIDLAAIKQQLDTLESQYYSANQHYAASLIGTAKLGNSNRGFETNANTANIAVHKHVWHYNEAIALPFIPEKLAIVGAGIDAIEIATIYQALGANVEILITGDDIFPELDKDINKTFLRYVKRLFKIKPQAVITAFNFTENQVQLCATSKTKALPSSNYDAVFIADVQATDDDLLTQPFMATSVPTVTWLGWTEKQLTHNSLNYKVVNIPWRSLGRANTDINTNGLTKLIFNTDDHTLIGGGCMGNNADEIFGEICLAIRNKFTADNITHTVHAHPTLHESILLASEVYKGTATDVMNQE